MLLDSQCNPKTSLCNEIKLFLKRGVHHIDSDFEEFCFKVFIQSKSFLVIGTFSSSLQGILLFLKYYEFDCRSDIMKGSL